MDRTDVVVDALLVEPNRPDLVHLPRDGRAAVDSAYALDVRPVDREVVHRRLIPEADPVFTGREMVDVVPVGLHEIDEAVLDTAGHDRDEEVILVALSARAAGSRECAQKARECRREQQGLYMTLQALPPPPGAYFTMGFTTKGGLRFGEGGGTSDSAPKVET